MHATWLFHLYKKGKRKGCEKVSEAKLKKNQANLKTLGFTL